MAEDTTDHPVDHRGVCGIGIYSSCKRPNFGTLVRSANCLGADYVFTAGHRYRSTPIAKGHDRHFPVFNLPQSVAAVRRFVDAETRVVAVELDDRATPLPEYTHHDKSVYVLGAEDFGIPDAGLDDADDIVSVPSTGCLNVAQTGNAVLYDRVSERHRPETPPTEVAFSAWDELCGD